MPGVAAQNTEARVLEVQWYNQASDSISGLAWSRDGSLCFVAYANGELQSHDRVTVCSSSTHAHQTGITQLANNSRHNILATADEQSCIYLWDTNKGLRLIGEFQDSERRWIDRLQWSADGSLLAASTANKAIILQDLKPVAEWRSTLAIGNIAWSARGKKLAIATNRGLHLWTDLTQLPQQLLNFPGAGISCAWHNNAQALAVGTQDAQLYFWLRPTSQSNSKAKQLSMRGYPAKVNLIDWHPHKLTAATAGGNDIVLWHLKSAKHQSAATALEYHTRPVTALTYQASGRLLASADRSGRICIWRDDLCLEHFDTDAEVTHMTWSAKGDLLAAGNQQGQTYVFTLNKATIS